jgi:hypothetical protein
VITHFAVRGNLGTKWMLSNHHALLSGFMFNPSALPVGVTTFGNFAQEDFKGITLGLQFTSSTLTTGVGGFFLWATGQYQIANTTQTSPLEHQLYGFIMTASYKL